MLVCPGNYCAKADYVTLQAVPTSVLAVPTLFLALKQVCHGPIWHTICHSIHADLDQDLREYP